MERKTIIEKFEAVYVEDHYPPIAGRILGLLFVTDKKYLTFQEILEEVGSSKGAISKALKILIDSGEVNFDYDVNNKRLRLFYLDTDGVIRHINNIVEAYKMQTELFKETLKIRSDENEEMNKFIKKTIVFNSEVLELMQEQLKKHYKDIIDKN